MEHPETFVDKLFSKLRYDEVYNNTDIEYDVDSTQVKESIILESYNTSLRGYRYYIEATGMTLELQAGGDCWKQFYSSDYSDFGSSMWPTLNIYFRNSNGLEDYWDYTSHSAGRAGTGYINDYSGNLTWVRGDLGFGGNRMPVSISHIYNANDVAGKNGEVLNEYGLGLGWRTNFNQTIKAVGSYYAWTDSDGTIHYFENRSGTYIDEDGLELTLTVGNGFVITDKYGNSSIFDTNGRLVQMQNNQAPGMWYPNTFIHLAFRQLWSRIT